MISTFITPLILATLIIPWLSEVDHQQKFENTAPKVTIDTPGNGMSFQWNTIIPYHINVVDSEDGNSAYDEIQGSQVFLSIRFLPDSTHLKEYLRVESRISQDVLLMMATSTCFNCHQMKTKLIGPSYASIAQKNPDNEASVKSLAQKVITGSLGKWGDVPMPPHPELKPEGAEQIVRWILKHAADPNQNYLPGLEGVFKTSEKPKGHSTNGLYVLTATYADQGDKLGASRKVGQDVAVLKSGDY